MACGGIYDQLGGGFHRYSVDATWTVPHFEKMLYDNALLARAYLHGFQVNGETPVEQCVTTHSTGLYARCAARRVASTAALDADSDGVEGRFYVWTLAQLREPSARTPSGDRLVRRHSGGQLRRPDRARLVLRRRSRTRRPKRTCASTSDERLLRGPRTTAPARPRRQAADLLERADDRRARRRRRGAGRAPLPRGGRSPARSSSCATCATATAGCCAPTTTARPRSAPTWRTTRSCWRR